MSERVPSLDVLRFIGLLAIFMAHTLTNEWELQIVSFDVVLLVLVSGAASSFGSKTPKSIGSHFIKRCVRLLIPAWIFLTIYFSIGLLLHNEYSFFKIVTFYTLFTDWYVWIIRVFLVVALLTPLLIRLDNSIKSDALFFLLISLSFGLFDFCTQNIQTVFNYFDYKALFKYVIYLLLVCVPYVFVYLIGLRLFRLSKKLILTYSILLLFIFTIIVLLLYKQNGSFIRSDLYKYPPRVYYICFTLGVSLLIWLVREPITRFICYSKTVAKIVLFIGQNTIWIYFWHVLFLEFVPGIGTLNRWLCLIIVFLLSVICYYFQYMVVNHMILPYIKNQESKKQVKRILCG